MPRGPWPLAPGMTGERWAGRRPGEGGVARDRVREVAAESAFHFSEVSGSRAGLPGPAPLAAAVGWIRTPLPFKCQ